MRKLFKNKNKKGFAMAELLAVSIVLLFIFSILFSNYLPLVAEYETRLSYNDVTAQYAAHYVRKMYKEALKDEGIRAQFSGVTNGTDAYKTVLKYDPNKNTYENQAIYGHIINDTNDAKKKELENIIKEYGIEEIIITNYKLKDDKDTTTKYVKDNEGYTKNVGDLYNYIHYLPNYEKSIYTGKPQNGEGEQLYRLILKTTDYGYATTPILSDYKTPGSCFKGRRINNSNDLIITHYNYSEENGCGDTVTINNRSITIENDQGTGKVTGKIAAIGDGVFQSEEGVSNPASQVKNVILPEKDGVVLIGDNAFKNSSLQSISNLEKVSKIGKSAFESTKLKEVRLTAENEYIGEKAFANTETINEVNLVNYPSSSTIGNYAFANNKILDNVTLPKASIYSKDDSGNLNLAKGLFKESGTGAGGIEVTIPSDMKYVGEEMFYLANIKGITLENGVQTIGTKAFSRKKADGKPTNYNVGTVNIPASVKEIQNESFEMLGINILNFNSGNVDLKILGGAFKGNKISTVTIPSRVSEIGNSAFEASGIQNLIFEKNDKINTIAGKTFYKNNIKSVIVPNSITAIGESAFEQNPDLSDLTLSSNLLTIGVRSFYNTGLTNVTIPGTVIKILSSAFQNSKLTEVEFSDGSDYLVIQNSVFQDTPLNTFTIPERVKSIGSNIFSGFGTNAKIYNKSKHLNDTNWCDKFSANNATCKIEGPDNENKLTITYTIESTYNTRYVYNMGGATNE